MSAVVSDAVDKVLFGVTTLEALGLQVDPVTGRLKEWTLLYREDRVGARR
ncbi:MAG: hypothetical protein ABWK01_06725 [Infirmifilum sp.]